MDKDELREFYWNHPAVKVSEENELEDEERQQKEDDIF